MPTDPPPSTDPVRCPHCGALLPAQAPQGLCPKCLFAGLAGATDDGAGAASPAPVPRPEELAPHFPQLEILDCLGRGGMGVVYRARQKALDRMVALKLLAPERVGDPAFAERFAREAQALAKLNHPHIVTIHDFGEAGGFFYLLMEFVDGVNLRQAMQAGRFTPEQALAIVPPVCEALQYAHEHGIVHRDIKPENLLLDKEGRVMIADFGIAKMLGESGTGVPPVNADTTAGTLASVAGTPQYMSPEQKAHGVTDHRADIYSLGVVLYELLTGELPADKLQPPSRKVQIDVRLDEIVLRALEKTPALRYQTAGEFRTQVETIVQTPGSSRGSEAQVHKSEIDNHQSPILSRFSRPAIVGACWAAVAVVAGVLFILQSGPQDGSSSPDAPGILSQLFGFVLIALGATAPFGTTILGWIAVAQIRRSAGKLNGLGLAVFDGLLFPLLALDALIIAVDLSGREHVSGPGLTPGVTMAEMRIPGWQMLLVLAFIVLVDWLIIHFVWRSVNRSVAALSSAVPTAPRSSNRTAIAVGFGLMVLAIFGTEMVLNHLKTGDQAPSVAPAASPAVTQNLSFGPVIERELTVNPRMKNFFLDLDTGTVLSAPKEIGDAVFSGNLSEITSNEPKIIDWMRANGADLFTQASDPPMLYQMDGIVAVLTEPKNKKSSDANIDNISAETVLKAIEEAGTRADQSTGAHYFDPSCATAFKTRGGAIGVLEIGNSEGRNARIRYKLVQTQHASSDTAKNEALPPTFGPIVQRFIATGKTKQSFYSIERNTYVEAPLTFPEFPRFADQSAEAKTALDQYAKWLADNDVDFLIQPAQGPQGEYVLALADMVVRPVLEEQFTDSVPKLMEAFKDNLEAEDRTRSPLMPLLLNIDSRLGTFYTAIFKTRKGRIGILQVVSVSDNPRGVNFRYKLVRGGATKAAIAKPASADATPAFGPVMERTLNDPNETLKDSLISLDSGTLRAMPDHLLDRLQSEKPEEDQLDTAVMDQWLRVPDQRFDALARLTLQDGKITRFGLRTFQLLAVAIEPEQAEQISPDQAVAKIDQRLHETAFISRINDLMTESGKPSAYIFKTVQGQIGILQITGFNEKPRGVNLRIKLVLSDATPVTQNAGFSEKTRKAVDALLPHIGRLTIALEHYPQEPIGHSLLIRTEKKLEPNFYISPLVSEEQLKKLLLRLAADGYFDRASGGPLPQQSSEMPIQAKKQPGYVLSVFCPESPQDSNHYTFHEDLSLQEGAAYLAAMKLRSVVEGEALQAMDTILGEIKDQSAVRITKEQIAQVEALLKKGPVTEDHLAAIWEHDETSGSSYRQRADVIAIPIYPAEKSTPDSTPLEVLRQNIPLGEVLHHIGDTTFYIQWDRMGASTLHYYGPYHDFDEITKVLGLKLTKGKSAAMIFGPEIERVVKEEIDLDTGNLAANPMPEVIASNSEKDAAVVLGKERKLGLDACFGEWLWGIDLKVRPLANKEWDQLTPEQLAEFLSAVPLEAAPKAVIRAGEPPPATFAFQTREGGMGVLQNFGVMADHSGVKIRYKLVYRNEAAPASAAVELSEQ